MFKTILLPVDLSAETTWVKALPAALRLYEPEEGALHVVTVLPDFGMSVVGSYFDASFEKKALHDIGEKLSEWVEANVPQTVEVHPPRHVKQPGPASFPENYLHEPGRQTNRDYLPSTGRFLSEDFRHYVVGTKDNIL